MKTLFNAIAKSWKSFVAQKKILPLIVFVDLLFLYGLARLHYEIFNRASISALKLTGMLGEQAQQIAASEAVPDLATLQSPEFNAAFHELVKYIGIFFIGGLVLWLVGKGIVWLLAHKTVEKKVDTTAFAKKFLGATVFWFGLFCLIGFFGISLIDYAMFSVIPLIGQGSANVIIALLLCVFAYFLSISYALLPKPALLQAFGLGFTRWKELVPVHIVSMLVLFVAATVPASLLKLNISLSLAFVVFIALPAVAWSRALWVTAVQHA